MEEDDKEDDSYIAMSDYEYDLGDSITPYLGSPCNQFNEGSDTRTSSSSRLSTEVASDYVIRETTEVLKRSDAGQYKKRESLIPVKSSPLVLPRINALTQREETAGTNTVFEVSMEPRETRRRPSRRDMSGLK